MKPKDPFENILGTSSIPSQDKAADKLSMSAADTLILLEKHIPKGDLNKELHKIRKGDINTENPEEAQLTAFKTEINGLTSFATEEIWNGITGINGQEGFLGFHDWLKKYPFGVLSVQPTIKGQEIHEFFQTKNPTEISKYLADATEDTLLVYAEKWYRFHKKRIASQTPEVLSKDISDLAFQRFEDIFPQRGKFMPASPGYETILSLVSSGMQSGMNFMWRTIVSLPRHYYEKFGKDISAAEFKSLMKSNTSLILKVASIELMVFSELVSISEKNGQLLRVIEENGKPKLDLTETAVKALEIADSTSRLRTGCPALIAKGSDGRSMLYELYGWLSKIAEEFYIPAIEKIYNH